jgi:hypothetical protein
MDIAFSSFLIISLEYVYIYTHIYIYKYNIREPHLRKLFIFPKP